MTTIADRYAAELLRAMTHELVLRNAGHRIAVSCSCLASPGGRCRDIIEARPRFPAAEAIASYRAWHAERGIEVLL